MKIPEIDKDIIIICPICNIPILIEKINCSIFRHAIYKTSGQQIDPHMSKENCLKLINENKIYGCGYPFRIVLDNKNNYIAEICDYI
jgi:hypothetical protein